MDHFNINIDFRHEMDYLFEKYEKLPYHFSMCKHDAMENWRYGRKSTYHSIDKQYPDQIAIRVLSKFVDKPYNDAFSYYCTLVPIYMQKRFNREIDLVEGEIPRHYWWRSTFYYVDDDGIIRKYKDKPIKPRYIYINKRTEVFKEEIYYHKPASGYARRLSPKLVDVTIIHYDKKLWIGSKAYTPEIANRSQHKINKEVIEKYYDFNRIKRKLKADEEDKLVRDNHGFDENSFKGIEYHGRARKREKKKNKLK